MYVDPEGCIDSGACIPACTSDSIHALEDVPEEKKEFIDNNRAGASGVGADPAGIQHRGSAERNGGCAREPD